MSTIVERAECRPCHSARLRFPPGFEPGRVGEGEQVDCGQRAWDAAAWAAEHECGAGVRATLRASACSRWTCRTRSASPGSSCSWAARSGAGAMNDDRRLCRPSTATSDVARTCRASTRAARCRCSTPSGWWTTGEPSGPVHAGVGGGRQVRPLAGEQGGRRGAGAGPGLRGAPPGPLTRALSAGGRGPTWRSGRSAMLGDIGHALVSAVEEALFFHFDRAVQPARLAGEGRRGANPALLDARAGGDRGTRRRTARQHQRRADREAAQVRRRGGRGAAGSGCLAWTIDGLLEDDDTG